MTLIGAGGLGKTRLALHIAADLLDAYPDGVLLTELAPLSDARLVSQAAASALGVTEEAGRPVIEALIKLVTDRRMLLHRDPADNAFLAPLMAKTRAALGSAAFDAAEGNSRALSYEAASAGARGWLESA